MKKIVILLAPLFFFAACKKNLTSPEPAGWYITSTDTLTSGQYWGISIGDSREVVYNQLKNVKNEKRIPVLLVENVFYNSLALLKDKLPLYNSIMLNTYLPQDNTAIQILFTDKIVSTIYSNKAGSLTSWPSNLNSGSRIQVGDNLATLHEKLTAISSNPEYARFFNKFYLSDKNLTTDYEEGMAAAKGWFVESYLEEKKLTSVRFVFNQASLDTILVQKAAYHY